MQLVYSERELSAQHAKATRRLRGWGCGGPHSYPILVESLFVAALRASTLTRVCTSHWISGDPSVAEVAYGAAWPQLVDAKGERRYRRRRIGFRGPRTRGLAPGVRAHPLQRCLGVQL